MKYNPTPFDRISLTICSILLPNSGVMSSNRRCASSKKNTNLGLSMSPTSGNVSNNVESIQSRNVEYISGDRDSF